MRRLTGSFWVLAGVVVLGALAIFESSGSVPEASQPAGVHTEDQVLPNWSAYQNAPIVQSGHPVQRTSAAASQACPPSLEFGGTLNIAAPYYNEQRGITEIYISDGANQRVIRHDIDSLLNHSSVALPVNAGIVWIAEDLDGDGQIELVGQHSDDLSIYSAPDWTLRARFDWPGYNFVMNPVAVNNDADSHLEIYVTPHAPGGSARAVIIDYDSLSGTFVKASDIPTPTFTAGRPAVGDFDDDGRMEFISGSVEDGYHLFEWQDTALVYIGPVGDLLIDMNYNAVACRPKPGGVLHALLGSSSPDSGFRYQLLEPTGDNTFEIVARFEEFTGFSGGHSCNAADTDCDGLDELVMGFHPDSRVWEWDPGSNQFVRGCTWNDSNYETPVNWYRLDLDQDSVAEWGALNYIEVFRVFPDPDCTYCDSLGYCGLTLDCLCMCNADPQCDSVSNVLDVVNAVDVAFRSKPGDADPFFKCPYQRTDADCDHDTDVLDVVHFINVAFRGGDPADEFCDPCGS